MVRASSTSCYNPAIYDSMVHTYMSKNGASMHGSTSQRKQHNTGSGVSRILLKRGLGKKEGVKRTKLCGM